jgi:hypothetical protein
MHIATMDEAWFSNSQLLSRAMFDSAIARRPALMISDGASLRASPIE